MERDAYIAKGTINYGAGLTLATGGIWTAGAMTLGALAIFNQDGSVVDGTATVAAGDITGDSIMIGMMSPYGTRFSVPIDRKSFKYTKTPYVAPVAAVKYLGDDQPTSAGSYSLNLPSTIIVGQPYGVSIRDRSKPHEDSNAVRNYMLNVTVGDIITGKISPNIITKLVALINADTKRIVNAVAMNDGTDNDGIQFTAITAGNDFDIIPMDGVLKNAQVVEYVTVDRVYDAASTTAVANNIGQGTPLQVAKAEFDASIQGGNMNSQNFGSYLWSESSLVVAGATYTTYSIVFTAPPNSQIDREIGFKQLIQIFVPSGDTGAGKVIACLDEIFALVNP